MFSYQAPGCNEGFWRKNRTSPAGKREKQIQKTNPAKLDNVLGMVPLEKKKKKRDRKNYDKKEKKKNGDEQKGQKRQKKTSDFADESKKDSVESVTRTKAVESSSTVMADCSSN